MFGFAFQTSIPYSIFGIVKFGVPAAESTHIANTIIDIASSTCLRVLQCLAFSFRVLGIILWFKEGGSTLRSPGLDSWADGLNGLKQCLNGL